MMRMVATPGYVEAVTCHGVLGVGAQRHAVSILLTEPAVSWVIGDPKAERRTEEDEGRTARIPAPVKFYAIRDEHPAGCDCGCECDDVQRSICTLLLPEEY